MAWEKELKTLEVNKHNDIMEATFGLDNIDFIIPHGTWSKTNIEALRGGIEKNFNNALGLTSGTAIGTEIEIEITGENKFRFKGHQSVMKAIWADEGDTDTNYRNYGLLQDPEGVIAKDAQGSTFNAALYGIRESYFFKPDHGCGVFRCRLSAIPPGNTQHGAYIGLSIQEGSDMSNFSFTTNKIIFGIHVGGQDDYYQYIKATTGATPSKHTATNKPFIGNGNDIIEIAISKGKVLGTVYSSGSNYELFNEEYTTTNELFPILAIADGNIELKDIQYTPRDEGQLSLSGQYSLTAGSIVAPSQSTTAVEQAIAFENKNVAAFLGFNMELKVMTDKSSEMDITADNSLDYFDKSEAYIAELMNLNCESYDYSEKKEKRRNMLALLQNHRNSEEADVMFSTDSPVMIDLNNDMDILLKNLNMRILNTNEEQVQIDGRANAILLVE